MLCSRQEADDMATDMAAIIDPDSRETDGVREEAQMEVEYQVQLAYTSEPVVCLAGTVSVIRQGRRDLALSETEWQDLELLGLPESPVSPMPEDVADAK